MFRHDYSMCFRTLPEARNMAGTMDKQQDISLGNLETSFKENEMANPCPDEAITIYIFK